MALLSHIVTPIFPPFKLLTKSLILQLKEVAVDQYINPMLRLLIVCSFLLRGFWSSNSSCGMIVRLHVRIQICYEVVPTSYPGALKRKSRKTLGRLGFTGCAEHTCRSLLDQTAYPFVCVHARNLGYCTHL